MSVCPSWRRLRSGGLSCGSFPDPTPPGSCCLHHFPSPSGVLQHLLRAGAWWALQGSGREFGLGHSPCPQAFLGLREKAWEVGEASS